MKACKYKVDVDSKIIHFYIVTSTNEKTTIKELDIKFLELMAIKNIRVKRWTRRGSKQRKPMDSTSLGYEYSQRNLEEMSKRKLGRYTISN